MLAISDLKHWWKYTRLRLFYRQARGWFELWRVKGQVIIYCKVLRIVVDKIVPTIVGMGLIEPWEGLECIRTVEDKEEGWKSWGKDKTFLGASKEHPYGIYAEKGSDLVCMTEDEYNHWYNDGRCDNSSGSQKRA